MIRRAIVLMMTLGVLATPASAQELRTTEVRVHDFPKVVQGQGENDHILRSRLDFSWDARIFTGVQCYAFIERWNGSKWVPQGPMKTFREEDGNLTCHLEGVVQPGEHQYRVAWDADAVPRVGSGFAPWRRKNERGPVAVIRSARAAEPAVVPRLVGGVPAGCTQKVGPAEKPEKRLAVAYAWSGCPGTSAVSAVAQTYEIQACITPGIDGCVLGWRTMNSVTRVVKGVEPRTTYTETWHRTLPSRWRYRLLMKQPTYRQRAVPPRVEANIVGPDIQYQYVFEGWEPVIDHVLR